MIQDYEVSIARELSKSVGMAFCIIVFVLKRKSRAGTQILILIPGLHLPQDDREFGGLLDWLTPLGDDTGISACFGSTPRPPDSIITEPGKLRSMISLDGVCRQSCRRVAELNASVS